MKIKIKKKYIVLCIIIAIALLLFVLGYSMAKYQAVIKGSVTGKIAKPLVELRGEQSLLVTAISPKASYSFEVRNYNDNNQINEVDMEYYIEIISKEKQALNFKLYNYYDQEEIMLENNKTKNIILTKDEKDLHKYRLDIDYIKDELNNSNLDINENVEIKIHSVQKV